MATPINHYNAFMFYNQALTYLWDTPYRAEIEWCRNRSSFSEVTPETFLLEYVYVVLNAGMKEQVARKIFEKFRERMNPAIIGHPKKREAVRAALRNYEEWFESLKAASDKIEYLDSLPWIGPITKYHLARNLGIDTVKPDRHLKRLADRFGFSSPMEMCIDIQRRLCGKENLGTIDVILWRYCNLKGSL